MPASSLVQDTYFALLGIFPLSRGPVLRALSKKTVPLSILFWFFFSLVPTIEDVYMDASFMSSV